MDGSRSSFSWSNCWSNSGILLHNDVVILSRHPYRSGLEPVSFGVVTVFL